MCAVALKRLKRVILFDLKNTATTITFILFTEHCKKIFSRFVITTYFLLSNQLYNNLFS